MQVDSLIRTHAMGVNKQEVRGLRSRGMIQTLGRVDGRSVVQAAMLDLLFGSGGYVIVCSPT